MLECTCRRWRMGAHRRSSLAQLRHGFGSEAVRLPASRQEALKASLERCVFEFSLLLGDLARRAAERDWVLQRESVPWRNVLLADVPLGQPGVGFPLSHSKNRTPCGRGVRPVAGEGKRVPVRQRRAVGPGSYHSGSHLEAACTGPMASGVSDGSLAQAGQSLGSARLRGLC